RHFEARFCERIADPADERIAGVREHSGIQLKALCREYLGLLDPVEHGHGLVDDHRVQVPLGEHADSHTVLIDGPRCARSGRRWKPKRIPTNISMTYKIIPST